MSLKYKRNKQLVNTKLISYSEFQVFISIIQITINIPGSLWKIYCSLNILQHLTTQLVFKVLRMLLVLFYGDLKFLYYYCNIAGALMFILVLFYLD